METEMFDKCCECPCYWKGDCCRAMELVKKMKGADIYTYSKLERLFEDGGEYLLVTIEKINRTFDFLMDIYADKIDEYKSFYIIEERIDGESNFYASETLDDGGRLVDETKSSSRDMALVKLCKYIYRKLWGNVGGWDNE